MSDRNWDAEMAKIDKQLASISDEQLLAERPQVAGKATQSKALPGRAGVTAAPAPAATTSTRNSTVDHGGTWRSWLKVIVAVGAAGSLMFWPWPARCGLPLVGFTAATGGVAILGLWSAIGTWRHRLGLPHIASLLVTVWGLMLGARELLPRVGYAIPSIERAGQWSCDGLPALPPKSPLIAQPILPTGVPNSAPPTSVPPAR